MKTVCHITSVHQPMDERIFNKECRTLAEAEYCVYLIQQGPSLIADGVNIVGLDYKAKNRVDRMITMTKRVYQKALSIDADIYHIHDPELLSLALKLKRNGKLVVFDSHENTAGAILEKEWIPKFCRKVVYRGYSIYQAYVCKRIDGIITVNEQLASMFRGYNNCVSIVSNYPRLSVEKKENNRKDFTLCFAGGITEQWNIDKVIIALASIPQATLGLCGRVDENYLNYLKSLDGWKQVTYFGVVDHATVEELLSKSSIGLALLSPGENTNWLEGTMGNTKIFEEMYAGLPVICTNFKLWSEFIKDKAGICIDPTCIDELIAAIEGLMNDEKRAMEMGATGKDIVLTRFNWNNEAQKLLELYGTLLDEEKEN